MFNDVQNKKCSKCKNIYFWPILHGCMNIHNRRPKFEIFWILLNSGFITTKVTGNLIQITKYTPPGLMGVEYTTEEFYDFS